MYNSSKGNIFHFNKDLKGRKGMKALEFYELTPEQKLGIVSNVCIRRKEHVDFAVELIKKHAIGSVWIYKLKEHEEIVKAIKEAADYPVFIMTDAEGGIGDYRIGQQNALSVTDSIESAYAFGKIIGTEARKLGYNFVCNPLLDMNSTNRVCCGVVRSLGSNKQRVTELAEAQIRGMHDAGVLCCAKHYPGNSKDCTDIDSHMGESFGYETAEELLDYNLYPYIQLDKMGILDSVMVGHAMFTNVDSTRPASLSKPMIDLLRNEGYDGICMTDALNMMGVVAKFGKDKPLGMCIDAGIDIALAMHDDNDFTYSAMQKCYADGMIDDARLDEAVKRIIAAQKKLLAMQPKEVTEKDYADFEKIHTDSVYARPDEGVPVTISRDGHHYFAILTADPMDINKLEGAEIGTNDRDWFHPHEIADRIRELFPNSTIGSISQFPAWHETYNLLERSLGHDDVIFVTFFAGFCYIGEERLTTRIISLMKAMQISNRISTVLHVGNPFVLEDVPHVERLLAATSSTRSALQALEVLAGNYPAKGKMKYDVKFN